MSKTIWQYKVVENKPLSLQKTLHYYGYDGWELFELNEREKTVRMIFKRKVKVMDSHPNGISNKPLKDPPHIESQ